MQDSFEKEPQMRAKICFQDSFEKEPQTVKKVHNIFAY
jgi:hypothetical protein